MSPFRSASVPRLFTLVAVVLLGACGGPSAEEDLRVCAEVECTAGRCVAENGAPVCRCGAFEEAAGLTCAIAAFRPSDDHGDTVETATLLAHTADFQEGSISPLFRDKVDRDVLAVPALAGHGFRFTLRPGTLTAVSWNALDAQGRRVHVRSYRAPEGEVVELVSTPEAPRFIELSAGTGREGSGTYSYRLEDLGKDAHGDTPATATPIAMPSAPFPVAFEFAGDMDFFTFRTEPGRSFRFSCEAVSVTLWDSAGAQVHGYVLGNEWRSSVGRMSQEASTWYVSVHKSDGVWSTQCRLDDLGTDEHANGMLGATLLVPGVPLTARLHGTNDVDVFSFEATQGHIYAVGVSPARERRIQLTDAAGKVLVESDWGRIVHEAASTGRYYVHVLQDAQWWSDFQVELKDLGLDDHGGTPETATRIEVGQSVEGLIHRIEDLDAIALQLDADGVYQVTCTPDCSLRASAPSSTLRMQGTSSRGVWKAHMLASARVTFLIDSRSPPYAFTFRVERVGTDDHGDDAAHATLVTLPVSLEGVFELGSDIDELAVMLEGGTTYVVSPGGAKVQLFDAEGASVPIVSDTATRTQRVTTTASGLHRVVLSSQDPLVGIAKSWHFTLSAP
ncbi:hypothetical protein LXT21_20070 [Myxococcus sp. K38C18041901]|uniref:hypothetical protein n=1 Tax=Myxococcus guangdongensis TaxID=2906760 RepID=UPI0020A77237|nr:hypothetical protein [Myxococcus guangdongensis]MCP3061082.1 hypothetical protein [Myxococcus guangdongensis]